MISASEARQKTEEMNKKSLENEIKIISMEVEAAISMGKNCVSFDGSISLQAKEYLKKLGYEVNSGTQYNESYYSVKW